MLACCGVIAAVLVGNAAVAEESAVPSRDQVVAVLNASAEAWSKGDLDAFMHCYEDAAATVYVGHDAVVHGYRAIHDMYAARFGGAPGAMGRLSMALLDFRQLGPDYAQAVGRYTLQRPVSAGGDATGIFTLTFHRSSAGWRIISDHTS